MASFFLNLYLRLDRILRKIVCMFILTKSARHIVMNRRILQYVKWKLARRRLEDKKYEYKYNLAVMLIVKNAAQYMDEWICYHKLVGVEHFYIYDNE